MSDYPSRVRKSENMYELWESGYGDMKELAIGLHDLTAQYKALYDDYIKLEAEHDALSRPLKSMEVSDETYDKLETELAT